MPAAVSSKNMDVIDGIAKYTKGTVVEYGADFKADINNFSNDDLDKIIKNIHECKNLKLDKIYNDNTYCINIIGTNINGYIESTRKSSGYSINLELIIRDSKNNLDNLVSEIKNIDLFKNNGVKVFRYMKVKAENTENIEIINNKIIDFLKSRHAGNISTIKLNDAYSTTAYMGNEDYIVRGNKAADINIAVCRYSSGTYIIIGTPEIIISY